MFGYRDIADLSCEKKRQAFLKNVSYMFLGMIITGKVIFRVCVIKAHNAEVTC